MAIERTTGHKSGTCGIGTCFHEHIKGWRGSGFEWQETEITVDRLDYQGRDELRLNIVVRTKTAKRIREVFSSLTLTDDLALAFIKSCSTKRRIDKAA